MGRRTWRAVVAAALWVAGGGPAQAEDDPFAPLSDVAGHLDRGLTAFLGGEGASDAFSPWRVETTETYGAALRDLLRSRRAADGRNVLLTLELHYAKGRSSVYRVWSSFLVDAGTASVLDLRGTEGTEPLPKDAFSLDTDARGLQPFAEAGRALDLFVRTPGQEPPAADVDVATKVLAWALPERVVRDALHALPANVSRARAALARIAPVHAFFRISQQSFSIRDVGGRVVAVLGGRLGVAADASVTYRMGPVSGPPFRVLEQERRNDSVRRQAEEVERARNDAARRAEAERAPGPGVPGLSLDAVTRMQAENIVFAVRLYEITRKKLPDRLDALTEVDPVLNEPWLETLPTDAWNRPFRYVVSAPGTFEVRSLGPDGAEGTLDDIVVTR